MNTIINAAIEHYRVVLLFLVLIFGGGSVAYITTPKEAQPDITIPTLYVSLSHDGISPEDIYDRPEFQFLLRRNDEILMELGRCREKVENLERSNLQLRQEAEEKDMLISMLMKKDPPG